jgi:hypothetical protein
MAPGLNLKFNEAETVAKIGLACIAAPWQCYAEAWGVGSNKSSSPPNPLEAGVGALFKMTDDQIQSQINDALKKTIW